jgi:hypothetical protein
LTAILRNPNYLFLTPPFLPPRRQTRLPVFDAGIFSKSGQRNPEFRIHFSRRQKPVVKICGNAGKIAENGGVRIA